MSKPTPHSTPRDEQPVDEIIVSLILATGNRLPIDPREITTQLMSATTLSRSDAAKAVSRYLEANATRLVLPRLLRRHAPAYALLLAGFATLAITLHTLMANHAAAKHIPLALSAFMAWTGLIFLVLAIDLKKLRT
ncbi:MAG: hypothetical protein ACLQVD_06170 [Capsulimonadaceae bacterium]